MPKRIGTRAKRPDHGLDVPQNARRVVKDYAQLVEIYGNDPDRQKRYSPAQCLGTTRLAIIGEPNPAHVSTSYVERQDFTMRMQIRRFIRLTNALSKKLTNHIHMVALFHMWYNFGRIHQTLQVTPAMEAGISQHVWSIHEIAELSRCSAMGLAAEFTALGLRS